MRTNDSRSDVNESKMHCKIVLLLYLFRATLTLAGVGFPFDCEDVGCYLCNAQRMKHVCYRFCSLHCVRNDNIPGGVSSLI